MVRFARYSVMVVVLLLLTGCSGFLGAGQESPKVSVTPAAVPTDSPTVAPRGQVAPGVTSAGVYNSSALAHAHARILSNTSFTIHKNLTHYYLNGTLIRQSTGILRVESGPPVLVLSHSRHSGQWLDTRHSNRSRPLVRDFWYGSDSGYIRTIYSNNTTSYNTISERLRPNRSYILTYFRRINSTLSGADTQVSRVTRNGSTYYRIEGTMPREHRVTSPHNKQNSSYWMLIDSRGVVQEYHHTIISSGPNGTIIQIHLDIDFQKVGNTTVTQPAWVETARKHTEPANRTATARS